MSLSGLLPPSFALFGHLVAQVFQMSFNFTDKQTLKDIWVKIASLYLRGQSVHFSYNVLSAYSHSPDQLTITF